MSVDKSIHELTNLQTEATTAAQERDNDYEIHPTKKPGLVVT